MRLVCCPEDRLATTAKGVVGYGVMPIADVVSLLIAERDRLNAAIALLQNDINGVRRRGRPPKNTTTAEPTPVVKRRRGKMSAAARKAQSERMKARWAVPGRPSP